MSARQSGNPGLLWRWKAFLYFMIWRLKPPNQKINSTSEKAWISSWIDKFYWHRTHAPRPLRFNTFFLRPFRSHYALTARLPRSHYALRDLIKSSLRCPRFHSFCKFSWVNYASKRLLEKTLRSENRKHFTTWPGVYFGAFCMVEAPESKGRSQQDLGCLLFFLRLILLNNT